MLIFKYIILFRVRPQDLQLLYCAWKNVTRTILRYEICAEKVNHFNSVESKKLIKSIQLLIERY